MTQCSIVTVLYCSARYDFCGFGAVRVARCVEVLMAFDWLGIAFAEQNEQTSVESMLVEETY